VAKKLTSAGLKRQTPPATGRVEYWDQEVRGFGCRIAASGIKSLQVLVRVNGRSKRVTLGRFQPGDDGPLDHPATFPLGGYLSLSAGRHKAREIISLARAGIDPEEAEREAMALAARSRANTYAQVAHEYIERYAKPRTRTWKLTAAYMRERPDWDPRPISSIARRDIIAALDEKARDSGPYGANRWLAANRGMFNWALSRDYIAASPFVGVRPAIKELPRERTLTPDEIAKLWAAWTKIGYPFGPALQLLLATGLRRNEIAALKWDEIRPRPIDAEASDDFVPIQWVVTLEGGRTKNKKQHVVPLNSLAVSIIAKLPCIGDSGFVFPAGRSGRNVKGYATGLWGRKKRSGIVAGVTGWRVHDLRRTVATGMAELGIPGSTIGQVLGHTERGITARHYLRYDYGNEKRLALEAWGRKLAGIVGLAESTTVVDLARARADRAAV
jgi:integrase